MLHLAPNLVNFSDKMSIEELNLTWPLLFWSYQADDSQAAEDDEPEPEEDVDLLVDDVDRQHTDGVVCLDCSGRTVLEENGQVLAFEKVVYEGSSPFWRNLVPNMIACSWKLINQFGNWLDKQSSIVLSLSLSLSLFLSLSLYLSISLLQHLNAATPHLSC